MFARIIDGKVWETVSFDPTGLYPDDFVWVACPDDTRQGATYDAKKKTFTNPPDPVPVDPVPVAPVYRTVMTPIRFKAQFSVGEQVSIKRARAYAGDNEEKAFARDALDILFGSLDDPRLMEVDVADPSVIGGIEFCQSIGILTAERAASIKLGAPAA